MSKTERFEPQAPTKKWPTPEELAEMASKITIPEKYYTEEKPLTPEILQNICRRLADETPLSLKEWRDIRDPLYGPINYSEQPEAQQIWELAIARSIDGLAHLIETETVEEIHKTAEDYEEGSPYKNPLMYWLNGPAKLWHNNIIRMLTGDAGTTPQATERLAKLCMDQASIPFTRRTKELGEKITPVSPEDPIWLAAQRIVYARMHMRNEKTYTDEDIEQLVNEAIQQV